MRKTEQLLSNEELTELIEGSRKLMGIKDQESIYIDFSDFKIYPRSGLREQIKSMNIMEYKPLNQIDIETYMKYINKGIFIS